MTPPLLPPGRAIAAVPPRADALATITREVHHRRARRRRHAYVVALVVLPLVLVAGSLSFVRGASHSLQPVTGLPNVPSATGDPGTGHTGGAVTGITHAAGGGSRVVPAPAPTFAAPVFDADRPAPGPVRPRLIPMRRGYVNVTDELTCPGGIAHDGWCVTALADMPYAPDVSLGLRVCRMDPAEGTLTWPTSREVEIEVWSGETAVYRWSAGRTFAPGTHSDVLSVRGLVDHRRVEDGGAPMCLLWTIVWPVVDDAGRSLDRDTEYTLRTWTYADGLSGVVASRAFNVAELSS